MEEEKFYTSGETAKLLGISQETLRLWDKNGKFKSHHISKSGYRYYSDVQINEFLNISGTVSSNEILPTVENISHSIKKADKKKIIKTDSEFKKPLFRLYVDSGSGKTLVNYYAMRSGKTNSLAFANNSKLFHRVTELVGEQEIFSDNDEYQFFESMHGVTITLDGKYLNSINAAIAKGVFWIQLAFTQKLNCKHPTDEAIEEARHMKWNISDYMEYCGLKDRKKAIQSMRKTLTLLSHAEIQWKEEVTVRNDKGEPVYSGGHRDKNGRYIPKVKKAMHTYQGAFISTRDIEPVQGVFEYWVNKEFATYLAHAGVVAIHEKFFQIDVQKNANALTLLSKLQEYYSMNKGKNQATVISVESLLNALPNIPKYETLTSVRITTEGDGTTIKHEKHGDKGGWRVRILNPFMKAFDSLVDYDILKKWNFRDADEPSSYVDFLEKYVEYEFNFDV